MQKWVKSQIAFVYMNVKANRFLEADYQLDLGYIRAFLRKNDIGSVQYIQDDLLSLMEVVDEIISLGNENIVFYVDDRNFRISRIISDKVKKMEKSFRVVWIGPAAAKHANILFEETLIDIVITENYERNILKLLEENFELRYSLPGVYARSDQSIGAKVADRKEEISENGNLPSPYIHRIIPVEKAFDLGIFVIRDEAGGTRKVLRLPDSIMEELDFISVNSDAQDRRLMLRAENLLCYPCLDELLSLLTKRAYRFPLACRSAFFNLTGDILNRLVCAGMNHMEITINGSANLERLNNRIQILKELSAESPLKISFQIDVNGFKDKKVAEDIVKTILDSNIPLAGSIRFLNRSIEENAVTEKKPISGALESLMVGLHGNDSDLRGSESEQLLIDRYMSYITGIYRKENPNGYAKLIGIAKPCLNKDEMSELSELVSVNNTFIFENDGVVKRENGTFDRIIDQAGKAGLYLSHIYNAVHDGKRNCIHLQLDDYCRSEPLTIKQGFYRDADFDDAEEFRVLEIGCEEDLEAFLADVDYFINTGTFAKGYLVQSYITDSCRWMGAFQCQMHKLQRFRLNRENEIIPCRSCKTKIGSLGDMQFDLLQKSCVLVEQEIRNRNCASCEVSDECSKCVMLPEFMSVDQYCRIRRERPYISCYMNTMNTLRDLKRHSQLFKNTSVKDIKISNKYFSHYLPNSIPGGERSCFDDSIYMFSVRDVPVIFHPASGKILKMSAHLAEITEAMIKGITVENLKIHLMKKFGLGHKAAVKSIEQAAELFTQAGLLRKAVI